MVPQTQPREKKRTKSSVAISIGFHATLIAIIAFIAKETVFKKPPTVSVMMVHEKDKPKPEERKPEPPKVNTPVEAKVPPPVQIQPATANPPPATVPPPAVGGTEIPGFNAENTTASTANDQYKTYMEYYLKEAWDKPDGMEDDKYVAEIKVSVNSKGMLGTFSMEKSSGNPQWDKSVRDVFSKVHEFKQGPPSGFPAEVTIRFDVAAEDISPIGL